MKTAIIYIILFLCFTGSFFRVNAQPENDSINKVLSTIKHDTTKVNLCNKICEENINTNSEKALQAALKALEISKNCKFDKGTIKAYYQLGLIYMEQGFYDKALENFLSTEPIIADQKDKNKIETAQIYCKTGIVYINKNDYIKARNYLSKSLDIYKVYKDKKTYVLPIYYLGLCHEQKGDLKSAIAKYDSALSIAKFFNDDDLLALIYNALGSTYSKKKEKTLAIENYTRSQNVWIRLKNKKGLCFSYNNFGLFHLSNGNNAEALNYFKRALKIAVEIKNTPLLVEIYYNLSQVYSTLKDFEQAYYYSNHYIKKKSETDSPENFKKIFELEMNNTYDKKRRDIENEQFIKDAQKDNELSKEKFSKNLLIIVLLITLISMSAILVLLRKTRQSNHQLGEQKASIQLQKLAIEEKSEELERQKMAILSQHELIEIQRDLATKQKDQLSKQKEEITDSILYASRIQRALLPQPIFIEAVLNEYFIVYKPRDIVSGDFYWLSYINNLAIVAVADCTGHGVPAAFMSILGVSLLKTIVSKLEVIKANMILNELREMIIQILHQTGKFGASQDGMDISLCVIDFQRLSMQFASANSQAYHLKNNDDNETVTLLKINPDKMPIGIHEYDSVPFTNHEFSIRKGDIIYMFTDGYVDQFGGEEGRKFMSRNLRALIMDIYHKPMYEQKEIFMQTNENWRNYLDEEGRPYEQVDDILVFAIKI